MKEEWFKHPTNLVDLFEDTIRRFPERRFLGTKNSDGQYDWVSYKETAVRVDNLRGGLAGVGVRADDAVGIIVNNSIEWAIIAFASYGLNARLIPMYESELEKTWKYIVEDSGIKVLFVANQEIYDKVKGYVKEIKNLKEIYIIQGEGESSMASLEKNGAEKPVASVKPFQSDIAALIYTSGTTGAPKGVLLSHGNFTSNVRAIKHLLPDSSENDITFSILPWAHSFGQTGELYYDIFTGASCGLMESVTSIIDDLPIVKPTRLMAVPRIFNKIYAGINNLMKQKGGLSEKLFNKGKELAAIKRETGKSGIAYSLINKIVFGKIRAKFGGDLKYAVTASAVMNPEIAQFFFDIGIPTYDCYGLTETSPAATCNAPGDSKLGTVGKPIQNVTVLIDKTRVGEDSEDGEILCFGPNIMQGYHNKPEQTGEIMVEDPELGSGIRTGDRGKIDEDGFLLITGRFKEEYKLENGKYVHPASLEEDIKLNPYILNAMVYGDGKKYNVGLIVPDVEALSKYVLDNGIAVQDTGKLIENSDIVKFLTTEIENQLKDAYGGYEIPKKFVFIKDDFTLEAGFLTQTMKLKRRNVMEAYGNELEKLYS